MPARFKALIGRRREGDLRIKLPTAQRHFPVRRNKRLEYGERLFRPPGLPAKAHAIPASVHLYRADVVRMEVTLKLKNRRVDAVDAEGQDRGRQHAAAGETGLPCVERQRPTEGWFFGIAQPAYRPVQHQTRRADLHRAVLKLVKAGGERRQLNKVVAPLAFPGDIPAGMHRRKAAFAPVAPLPQAVIG